jgi:hypothetical protein
VSADDCLLVLDAKEDFELSRWKPTLFKAKVQRISRLLGLGEEAFLDNYHATYFVGDFTDDRPKDVLFGINPGFDAERDLKQAIKNFDTWEQYVKFMQGFFSVFDRERAKVRYYLTMSKLYAAMNHIELNNWSQRWKFFQTSLVTLELIPYHSKGIKLPSNLTSEQLGYLNQRLEHNLDFLRSMNVRSVVFNGKIYSTLLKSLLGVPISLNKRLNMYLFDYQGNHCILFDKFVSGRAAGVSNEDMRTAASKFNDWISQNEEAES